MSVSREAIDEIKRRNDLVEVVAEHGIELTRRGRGHFGLCPFHEEKAASFAVSRESGLFHCFGCGVGGDVIGFVVRKDGLTFRDALRTLAERAGVGLEEAPQQQPRVLSDELRRGLQARAAVRFAERSLGRRP